MKTKPLTKANVLTLALVTACALPMPGQTVFWDGGGGNYSWHTAANWSNDKVPGPTNDVVIAVTPDVTITFSSGITYVRSVQCTNGFTLSGGLLFLTEGASQFDGPVTLGPNTSLGGGLYARGTGTVVTVNGPATYNGGVLQPEQGGTLRLPGLRTLDLRTRNASFIVQNAGSVLDLSGVTNVLLAGNYYLALGSTTGGRIDLSQAAIPNGRVTASANGPESLIDLSSVQGVWSNSLSSSKSSLVAWDGGEIRMPGLTGLSHVDVSLYDPASRLTTAGLRTFVDGQFSVRQRTNDLATVTNLANCTLVVESGSVVPLTNFSTLRVTNGSLTITVRGAGSLVDLSSTTNIVQTASQWLYLNAETGGKIDLSKARNPTGGIDFKADGVGSLIDLSAVQGAWSNLLNSAYLTVSGGGEIVAPELTDLSRISLTVSGPTSRFPTAQLRSIVGATLTVQQATNDFPSLTSILNTGLWVQDNGVLRLPNVTALWITNGSLSYYAEGAQSRLDLSAVTNVALAGNYSLYLSARNGGRIDLSRARLAEGAVGANANGAGSLIDLSSVQGVWGNRLSTSGPSLTAEAGGEIRMPGLTGLFGVNLNVIGPDSRFPTAGLQSFVGGLLTVGQTTNDFSSLTNLGSGPGTSTLGLTVQNNATLVVSNVSSLWLTNGSLQFSATGPNSRLDLSSVTNVVIARTNSLTLQAQNGGSINLAQARIPDGRVSATADGIGSLIDLSSVQGAWNNTTGNNLSALTVTSGGEIRLPGLTDLYRVNLTINGQNSRFPTTPLRSFVDGVLMVQQTTNDFSNLTNILNSDLTVQSYSALLLTNVPALWVTNQSASFVVAGPQALLDLSGVTNVLIATNTSLSLQANSGARINLSNAQFSDGRVTAYANGAGSLIDLSSATGSLSASTDGSMGSFEVRAGATILIPNVTELDHFNVTIRDTGVMTTTQIRALTYATVTISGATVPFTNLVNTLGTTFTYLNGGKIIFPPIVDFVVTDLRAPPAAPAGQFAEVVWTVKNQNTTNTASGERNDAVYLSKDNKIGNDTLLAHFPSTEPLGPGESRTSTNLVILPGGLSGNYYFVVAADSLYQFYEGTGETNNSAIAGSTISIASVDLAATNITVTNATTQFGQMLWITWTVRNTGTTNATGWSDRVYLSLTNKVTAESIALCPGLGARSALAAGASYTNTTHVTLPLYAGLAAGNYYLVVAADYANSLPESNETNNWASRLLSVSIPPLPDLVTTRVLAPSSATAGQTIDLALAVTNQGMVSVTQQWVGAIYITNAALGRHGVALFDFTNALPVGALAWHTQAVVVPTHHSAGAPWFQVEADYSNRIVEKDEGNNLGMATNATQVPLQLTLEVPFTQIAEKATKPSGTATIIRNGSLDQPLTVSLASSDTNELIVPPSVTIPARLWAAFFTVQVVHDGFIDGPKTVTLTATANDYATGHSTVTVRDSDFPKLTLTLTTNIVLEGLSVAGRVTCDLLATNPITVQLHSSDPGQVSVPASLIIPAGANAVDFRLLAVDDTLVERETQYSLAAYAPGFESSSLNLIVLDNDWQEVALTLAQSKVSEGAGQQATFATITRRPVSARSLLVDVVSSNTNAAQVPPRVTIPANNASVSFPVTAVNDSAVDGSQTAVLTPYVVSSGSKERLAQGASATLTVADDDGPTLQLAVRHKLVAEGNNPATQITVSRNTPATNALVVTLTSSHTNEATVPPSVTIPSGTNSATFPLASVADGTNDGSQTVLITASTPGYTQGSDTVVVSDMDFPDLVVSSITVPAVADTELYTNITYRVVNQGLAPVETNFTVRIYLSSDPYAGEDTLAGQFTFRGTIPVGQYFEQTLSIYTPLAAGQYWLVVQADANLDVPEALEDNNTRVSATPMLVRPAYSPVAQVDLDTALAGTPVPLHGWVTNNLGQPVPFKLVNLHILTRDTRRVISALTDFAGNFATTWQPLPTESGYYQVYATHPGVTKGVPQDQFNLLGIQATPNQSSVRILEQSSGTGTVRLDNLSAVPLTGLSATVQSKPNDLGVNLTLGNTTLPASGSVELSYTLTAPSVAAAGPVQVRVTSAEGASADIAFAVTVLELRPRLVATPANLLAGMARDYQTLVQFQVVNEGGVASGPLGVVLPEFSWLGLACTNPLPPLGPGETNVVTLRLTPPADLLLGSYTGNLVLAGTDASLSVPFEFRALSEAKGALRITAVDEYTYYAEGSPNLAGASVVVRDAVTQTNVAQGLTGTNGQFLVSQLPEAYYEIEITAPKHTSYRNTTLVAAGVTNEVQAFLSREAVQYQWTVVPTETEDRYRIVVETTFETMVPMPVVTIEPKIIDLSELTADVTQIDVKISNHGLIAAQNLNFRFPQHLRWQVSSIVTRLGDLPARSSITVPLIIRRLQTKDGAPDPCQFPVNVDWEIPCGVLTIGHTGTIMMDSARGSCRGQTTWLPGFGYTTWGNSGGVGWGEFLYRGAEGEFTPWKVTTSCDPMCLLLAVLSCVSGGDKANAIGCAGGTAGCVYTCATTAFADPAAAVDCVVTAGGCAALIIPPISCVYTFTRCFFGPASSGGGGGGGGGGGPVADVFSASASPRSRLKSGTFSGDAVAPYRRGVRAMFDVFNVMAGAEDGVWFNDATGPNMHNWLQRLKAAGGVTSEVGVMLSDVERVQLLAGTQPEGVSRLEMEHFLDRWNRTMTNWSLGILSPAQLPQGGNPDFCDFYAFREQAAIIAGAQQLAEQNGFTDPLNAIYRTLFALSQEGQSGGVCARVKLRTEQQAVVSRDAFRAALEIDNSDAGSLEQVEVSLTILDQNGQDATALFGIRPPELAGLTGVNGSGLLPGQTIGSARWEIIPSSDAAPTNPAVYFVAGRLKYVQSGNVLSVPLAPTDITVLPNPRLFLHYFHERDVFSDDPFTDKVEPSVPFNLAVMIQNQGYGTAKNFRLTSAQPQIVENEKGLLIDFTIIATEVAGRNMVPSLTAEFGDINPGQTVIGRWLMTSTLQGLFIDYSASFEHVDALGDQKLSLIEDVNIHEMVHLVQAGGTFEDGKPDFLVNDVADVHDRPETLWLSDGSTQPVGLVEEATPDGVPTAGDLQVQLTALMPAGWVYLHVPEPANGKFRLARVERSDGGVIPLGVNVWVTDRTFIGMARRPAPENILHLLDYDSTGTYTLTYVPWPVPDTAPPASQVARLPAESSREIPVSWNGQDNQAGSGLASYDIYVSENHGLFAPWLLQTPRNGATYAGTQGSTYSFYSVAVDRAGNREALPATPDAETSVTLSNRPPALTAPGEQFVDEGREFAFTVTANDPDLPNDRLTFSLSSAPFGMSINPATGLIRWPTGEGNGPSTNRVTVTVQDAGAPPLMATGSLTVVVREVNSAPTLAPIADQIINEGFSLNLTNVATDADLPANLLRFSPGPGWPAGATIDPVSGVFHWQPTETQGPSTNLIAVMVTDNGSPSLGATQQFRVVVRDTRAEFTVSLGSTNLLAGESGAVPVWLDSGLELQSLSFDLKIASPPLTNLTLQPIAQEVGSAVLLASGSNRWQLEFTAASGFALQGAMPIAQLSFTAASNGPSAMVRLEASDLAGLQSNWLLATNGASIAGRVIVVFQQPVLWCERPVLPGSPGQVFSLQIYGQPGHDYELQWSTNLTGLASWEPWLTLPQTNRMLRLDWTNDNTPALFLRAHER